MAPGVSCADDRLRKMPNYNNIQAIYRTEIHLKN